MSPKIPQSKKRKQTNESADADNPSASRRSVRQRNKKDREENHQESNASDAIYSTEEDRKEEDVEPVRKKIKTNKKTATTKGKAVPTKKTLPKKTAPTKTQKGPTNKTSQTETHAKATKKTSTKTVKNKPIQKPRKEKKSANVPPKKTPRMTASRKNVQLKLSTPTATAEELKEESVSNSVKEQDDDEIIDEDDSWHPSEDKQIKDEDTKGRDSTIKVDSDADVEGGDVNDGIDNIEEKKVNKKHKLTSINLDLDDDLLPPVTVSGPATRSRLKNVNKGKTVLSENESVTKTKSNTREETIEVEDSPVRAVSFKEYTPLINVYKPGINRLLHSDKEQLAKKGEVFISENCVHFMATYAIRSSLYQIGETVYWVYDQEFLRTYLENKPFSGDFESIVPSKQTWSELFKSDVVCIPINASGHWSVVIVRGLKQLRPRKGRKAKSMKTIYFYHCDSMSSSPHNRNLVLRVIHWLAAGLYKVEVGTRTPIFSNSAPSEDSPIVAKYQELFNICEYKAVKCCQGAQKSDEFTCGWFTVLNALRFLRHEISAETEGIESADRSISSFMQWIECCLDLPPDGTRLAFQSFGGIAAQQLVVNGFNIPVLLGWLRKSIDNILTKKRQLLPVRYASTNRTRDSSSSTFRNERSNLNTLVKDELFSKNGPVHRVQFIVDGSTQKLTSQIGRPAANIALCLAEYKYSSNVFFAMRRFPSSFLLVHGVRNIFLGDSKLYGHKVDNKVWKEKFQNIFKILDVSCVSDQNLIYCFSPKARSRMQELAVYMIGVLEHISNCFLYAHIRADDFSTSFFANLKPLISQDGSVVNFESNASLNSTFQQNEIELEDARNAFKVKNSFDHVLTSVEKAMKEALGKLVKSRKTSPHLVKNKDGPIDETFFETVPEFVLETFSHHCFRMLRALPVDIGDRLDDLLTSLSRCFSFFKVQYNSRQSIESNANILQLIESEESSIYEKLSSWYNKWLSPDESRNKEDQRNTAASQRGKKLSSDTSNQNHEEEIDGELIESQENAIQPSLEPTNQQLCSIYMKEIRQSMIKSISVPSQVRKMEEMYGIQILYLLQPYLRLFHRRSSPNHSYINNRCQHLSNVQRHIATDFAMFRQPLHSGSLSFPTRMEQYQLESMKNILLKELIYTVQESLLCVPNDVDDSGREMFISPYGDPRPIRFRGKVKRILSTAVMRLKERDAWYEEGLNRGIGALPMTNESLRDDPSGVLATIQYENDAAVFNNTESSGRFIQFKPMDLIKLNLDSDNWNWAIIMTSPKTIPDSTLTPVHHRKNSYEVDILLAATRKDETAVEDKVNAIHEHSNSMFYQPADVNFWESLCSYITMCSLHTLPSPISEPLLDPIQWTVKQISLYQTLLNNACLTYENDIRTEQKLQMSSFMERAEYVWNLSANLLIQAQEEWGIVLNERQRQAVISLFLISHIQKNSQRLGLNTIMGTFPKQLPWFDRDFWASRSLFLHGPPGTGKTKVLYSVIAYALKLQMRVIMLSTTNNAVDNLMSTLLPSAVSSDDDFRFVRIGSNTANRNIRKMEIGSIIERSNLKHPSDVLNKSKVTFSTYGSAIRFEHWAKVNEYDIIIVDEASHAHEGLTTACLARTIHETKLRVRNPNQLFGPAIIYVGDPMQQDPFRHDDWTRYSNAPNQGLFFSRIVQKLGDVDLCKAIAETSSDSNSTEKLHSCMPQTLIQLETQYRMAEPICNLVSTLFYDGKLKFGGKEDDRLWVTDGISLKFQDSPFQHPVISLVDMGGLEVTNIVEKDDNSWMNIVEAEMVQNIVSQLQAGDPIVGYRTAVLTPYKRQVQEIRRRLNSINFQGDLQTIDSSQGREYDIVIISLVRGLERQTHGNRVSLEFLENPKVINVALSRAREKLIILAAENEISSRCETWREVFQTIRRYSENSPHTFVFRPIRKDLNDFHYESLT